MCLVCPAAAIFRIPGMIHVFLCVQVSRVWGFLKQNSYQGKFYGTAYFWLNLATFGKSYYVVD